MSRESKVEIEKMKKVFRSKMILTLVEVATLIDSSIHTARRRLKQWQALTSYNKNGKYYALPDVPKFDDNGLWKHHGVFFSKYGNLKKTVVELVCNSPAGLDACALRSMLGLDPRSFLSAFSNHPQLRRKKSRGRFVYYSVMPTIYDKQQQLRHTLNVKGRQPTPSEAVAILVEMIKHPALSTDALTQRLRRQNIFVTSEIIQNLFLRHDLTLKKTPHSA